MATNNAINVSSAGIVGFTGTAFVETTATNHAVLVGGASTSTFTNVGPTATSGQVLQSAGSSADPAFSTATYPASSGGTGKILYDNGTNFVESTPTFPASASATSGKIIISDGTNWISSTPTYPNAASTALKHIKSDGTNFVTTTVTYPDASVTAGKVIVSDGTNYIASTPTFPNASATSGKIIISDGTNWIASTPTYPNTSGSAGKVVVSDGTNNVYSTPTFPNASATTRKIIVSDGTNWVASTETWATPGTSGNLLTSDGTNWTSAAPAAAGNGFPTLTNALGNVVLLDDFCINAAIAGSTGNAASSLAWNGGNSWPNATAPVNGHPGVWSSITFNNASPTQVFLTSGSSSNPALVLGNGVFQTNWIFNIVTLSTGTNTYTLRMGLLNSLSSPADAVCISYSSGLNSGQWQLITAKASSVTTTNTAIAVTTGWHNLQVVVNAAASSVTYTIDGVAQTAIVTNLPNTSTNMFLGFGATCTAGTIPVNALEVDLFYASYTLTTPRT